MTDGISFSGRAAELRGPGNVNPDSGQATSYASFSEMALITGGTGPGFLEYFGGGDGTFPSNVHFPAGQQTSSVAGYTPFTYGVPFTFSASGFASGIGAGDVGLYDFAIYPQGFKAYPVSAKSAVSMLASHLPGLSYQHPSPLVLF